MDDANYLGGAVGQWDNGLVVELPDGKLFRLSHPNGRVVELPNGNVVEVVDGQVCVCVRIYRRDGVLAWP